MAEDGTRTAALPSLSGGADAAGRVGRTLGSKVLSPNLNQARRRDVFKAAHLPRSPSGPLGSRNPSPAGAMCPGSLRACGSHTCVACIKVRGMLWGPEGSLPGISDQAGAHISPGCATPPSDSRG